MNELKIFENPEFGEIRTVEVNGEPWFVGKDVAKVLGYIDTSDALKKHIDEEDKLSRCFADSGQSRKMYIINESGLYSLILSSKLPTAKAFKRWVTSEVLPAIRRTGGYIPTTPQMSEQEIMAKAVQISMATIAQQKDAILALESRNAIQEQIIHEMQPKADYTDMILQSKSVVNINQIAKDYGMTAQEMNKILHEIGIQYKQGGQWLLYKKYHSNGYTHSETFNITHKDGTPDVVMNTKWTQKGRLFLYEKLKEYGYLPMIERGA
ncbi:MAG TPA: phage antirepressor KilAC domain-containing protein [Candidatus Butyricicoccus avistercoris]|uniref:Phage antirepressor KilAC domain-containing protein n=1 Tax=Candidatus Butyricicoccus avistercoris TaxID=2838518 RepID=A0A9D1TIF3_9FIRM|nr:phage antirepressor KilAC domain-containing protein [Candidatus Butyricicoccus avistercoris]